MNSAKVFICGAGPGDPGLISVKGYRLLRKCDVVLYDRLVSKKLVAKIPSTIKKSMWEGNPEKPPLRISQELTSLC